MSRTEFRALLEEAGLPVVQVRTAPSTERHRATLYVYVALGAFRGNLVESRGGDMVALLSTESGRERTVGHVHVSQLRDLARADGVEAGAAAL